MASVVHPRVEPWEFDALQFNAGWSMDMELIAGEAVVVPPIGGPASDAQGKLHIALSRWQEEAAGESLVLQDVFVAFPDGSRPAPDISYWSAERCPPVERGAMKSVPDLVVEVLSPSTRDNDLGVKVLSPSTRDNDLGVKRELYMRCGVRELWLVDPDARTVTRVRSGSVTDEALDERDTLKSELLPGFALEVSRIFAHARETPARAAR